MMIRYKYSGSRATNEEEGGNLVVSANWSCAGNAGDESEALVTMGHIRSSKERSQVVADE